MFFFTGLIKVQSSGDPADNQMRHQPAGFRLPPVGGEDPPAERMKNGSTARSNGNGIKPTPMGRKPTIPSLPKVRALFDYRPQDLDELELTEGDIVEVLKERKIELFLFMILLF